LIKMPAPQVTRVKRMIFGDILVSDSINEALKRWRKVFGVSQVELAKWMGIASSVISEYENERNRSPGTRFLKKFVDSLVEIDMKRGGKIISLLLSSSDEYIEEKHVILMMQDFFQPFKAEKLVRAVDGKILTGEERVEKAYLYGFTVIDSLGAIMTLSGESFYRIFGRSTERALIFTNVSTGRSPMVAIRVYPFKPRVVVVHKPRLVDRLSVQLAQKERIIYVLSRMPDEETLINSLTQLRDELLSREG